jgi:branched-chain amino acid transport system substrate-binding protein
MSRCIRNTVAMILTALAVGLGSAAGGEDTIKIGYTDPLSGPFALVGQQLLQQAQYAVDYINAKGGALGRKFELVAYDNKSQPSEELIALKSITDQRMPFVFQTAGSNVAAALIDAVEKHNARNPDNRVLYINNGARATDLTNEKCSFWHFRFDVNTQQLALMMVRGLPPDIKQVYLLNQDYLFGQSMQRDIRQFLGQFRADIQLVGDELIPLGKIKDFSPYVTKINASGAQALVTGNWGPDLTLLIKAGMDAGLRVKWHTMIANIGGTPTAIGPSGEGLVLTTQGFNENVADEQGDPALKEWVARFRATHDFDFYAAQYRTTLEFLQAAIEKVGSTDAVKVAEALEGMTRMDMLGHEVIMRAEDHQLLFPYYVSIFSKDVKYDSEKTGIGWKPVAAYEAKELAMPTTCKMKRPGV